MLEVGVRWRGTDDEEAWCFFSFFVISVVEWKKGCIFAVESGRKFCKNILLTKSIRQCVSPKISERLSGTSATFYIWEDLDIWWITETDSSIAAKIQKHSSNRIKKSDSRWSLLVLIVLTAKSLHIPHQPHQGTVAWHQFLVNKQKPQNPSAEKEPCRHTLLHSAESGKIS